MNNFGTLTLKTCVNCWPEDAKHANLMQNSHNNWLLRPKKCKEKCAWIECYIVLQSEHIHPRHSMSVWHQMSALLQILLQMATMGHKKWRKCFREDWSGLQKCQRSCHQMSETLSSSLHVNIIYTKELSKLKWIIRTHLAFVGMFKQQPSG